MKSKLRNNTKGGSEVDALGQTRVENKGKFPKMY